MEEKAEEKAYCKSCKVEISLDRKYCSACESISVSREFPVGKGASPASSDAAEAAPEKGTAPPSGDDNSGYDKDSEGNSSDEDEIRIDFSAIGRWFGRGKHKDGGKAGRSAKEVDSAKAAEEDSPEDAAGEGETEAEAAAAEDTEQEPAAAGPGEEPQQKAERKEEAKEKPHHAPTHKKARHAEEAAADEGAEEGADEDIRIDFSGLKSLFGGKKQEKEVRSKGHAAHHRHGEPGEGRKEGEAEQEDEDIRLDFSGIRNLFGKKKGEEHAPSRKQGRARAEKGEEEGEEIGFDFSQAVAGAGSLLRFLDKHKIVFLILIPVLLSAFLRMQVAGWPITDNWAENSVYNYYRSQIAAQVDQQYPNLPDANKDALVNENLQILLKQSRDQYREQVRQTSSFFKQFFLDDQGRMYVPDIDPYYWFRYARNILDTGRIGDSERDGVPWDDFQVAPVGREIQPEDRLYPYILAYFYRFLHLFSPDLDLLRGIMYFPVVASALAVVPIFLIARRIGGPFSGFLAAILFAINSAYLNRTLFGHADSDAILILMSVLGTWLFLEAFEADRTWKQALLAAVAGASFAVFSRVWGGWWYLYIFLIASLGLYSLYYLASRYRQLASVSLLKELLREKESKQLLVVAAAFIGTGTVLISFAMGGFGTYAEILANSVGFTNIKAPVEPSLWPNVLTTVAELNPADSIDNIISTVGGAFLFYFAAAGIVAALLVREKDRRYDRKVLLLFAVWLGGVLLEKMRPAPVELIHTAYFAVLAAVSVYFLLDRKASYHVKLALLLAIWFAGTMYASLKGIRFTLLLVPALSIAFGAFAGALFRSLSRLLSRGLHVERIFSGLIVGILIATILVFPRNLAMESYSQARGDIPIVNDAWYNSLAKIRDNSSSDAIITSWWDFGHHFKALAERRVTFDGTTQGSPQAHWVGRLLLTDNEDEAVGILRMLDCGGNRAFDELFKINNDTLKSIRLVKAIILQDRAGAERTLLQDGLSKEQAENVLQYSHCSPPEAFLITSEDMGYTPSSPAGKSGVWGHFGSWNFERAAIWYNTRGLSRDKAVEYMKARLNYTEEEADRIYFEVQSIASDAEANSWVAPWPSYLGGGSCSRKEGTLACGMGVGQNQAGGSTVAELTLEEGGEINLTMKAYDRTGALIGHEKRIPPVVVYPAGEGIVKREFNNSDFSYGFAIVYDDDYWLLAMSPEQAAGMFTRLHYMRGHGLRHFKLFSQEKGLTGSNIYVWKVDWEGKEMNRFGKFSEKEGERVAESGNKVTLNYIGWLDSGEVFDSSISGWQQEGVSNETPLDRSHVYSPFTFTVGSGDVIEGFDEAVRGMKVNETRVFAIPPEKAYSEGPLANRTLHFRIRVEAIE